MKIRKSTIPGMIIVLGLALIVLSCSKTERESIQQESLHTISLTSPQGYQIASSIEELKNVIVNHLAEFNTTDNNQFQNIVLTNITYYKVSSGACALVSYRTDDKISNIIIGKGKLHTLTNNINEHVQTSSSNTKASVMILPTEKNAVSSSADYNETDCCTINGNIQTNGIMAYTHSCAGSTLNRTTKIVPYPILLE